MATLKLKIKKQLFKRKVEGATLAGYIGRVITNGKASFDEIARESAKNTTLHPKEASLAAELLLEGVCEKIKQGIIVDLGPLGTLYPAVNSAWHQDKDDLELSEMTPKVNYTPSNDIASAVRGATLGWATEEEEKKPTTNEEAGDDGDDTDNTQQGGGQQGGGGNDGDDTGEND